MRYQAIACAMAASAALGASAAIAPAYLDHLLPARVSAGGEEPLARGGNPGAAAAAKFPLEVVFVEQDGKAKRRLDDKPVVIRDRAGKVVFSGRADGPRFLARLPAGRYTVSTRWDSWTFTKPVTIGRERQRVVFDWMKLPHTVVEGGVADG